MGTAWKGRKMDARRLREGGGGVLGCKVLVSGLRDERSGDHTDVVVDGDCTGGVGIGDCAGGEALSLFGSSARGGTSKETRFVGGAGLFVCVVSTSIGSILAVVMSTSGEFYNFDYLSG